VPISHTGSVTPTLPSPEVYDSSDPFPGVLRSEVSIQKKRGYEILVFTLYPVEYISNEGKLSYYEDMTVEVDTEPFLERSDRMLRRDPHHWAEDREEIREIVDNPEAVDSYPPPDQISERESTPLDPTMRFDYVVITNQALKDSAGAHRFQHLVTAKQNRGINATLVTTEWIYANYSGSRPDGGTDNQTRIRNFIIDAFQTWGTEYILLGGDGDGADVGGESGDTIIPHRGFAASDDTDIPADMYYGCLDGTFDYDADGIYGEPNDGQGGGEVDLYAEVYVGRAAVDSEDELSNFVRKTLAYEGESDTYLSNAWTVGEYLGFGGDADWGCNSKDDIKNGSSATGYTTVGFENSPYASFFDTASLCDRDYPGNDWPKSEIINVINSPAHIINHDGHASVTYVMKMYNSDVDGSLTNDHYFIGYSQGCYDGALDNRDAPPPYGSGGYLTEDCISEHLTTEAHGAVAFVGNSRYGWGYWNDPQGPSTYYDRQFWDAVLGENIFNVGRANQDSKEDTYGVLGAGGFHSIMRWVYYELNVFGDPELMIKTGADSVMYQSHTIDDDNSGGSSGNNNGRVDVEETIEMDVTLLNARQTKVAAVMAMLSTTDSYVSLTSNLTSYGDMASGGSATGATPYVFSVDLACPDDHWITFTLDITGTVDITGTIGTWNDTFQVEVHSEPQIEVTPDSYDETLDWGEAVTRTLTITNSGPGALDFELREIESGFALLLVDDDGGGSYDARPYFEAALSNLGVAYDIFDTAGGNGPSAAQVADYPMVIWFSGDTWNGTAGPNSTDEANLVTYLDGGGTLFLSSQDYYYDMGLTSFMQTYLGVTSVSGDVGHTSISGVPGDPIGGDFGTLPLSYPGDNYSDNLIPDGMASAAFSGSAGNYAAIDKEDGYRTVFFGFPWEAVQNNNPSDGEAVMWAILDWLVPADVPWLSEDPITGTVSAYSATPIAITFDASELDIGTYEADIVISSNDPDGIETVPVTLTVTVCGDPIVQVTDDPADDGQPGIARTSDGKLWVVWDSWRSDNNIWYKTSDDNGVTWSADTQLITDPGSDYDPAIMQAGDGIIWVVWHSYRSGNADIWYKTSTDGGVTWPDAIQLTTDPNGDYSPAITQAGDGTIWVVWYSYRSGNADIWYKTSANGGASWSSAIQLTTTPEYDYRPAIAQASDGKIWVLWDSWRSDHPGIWYRTSDDGGASWSADSEFSTETNWDYAPAIAQTSDGTIWIARMSWSWDLWNWDIWYRTSNSGGTTWSADRRFTRFTGDDMYPGLAALPGDQAALVWSSDRAVNYDIWFGIIGVHGDVNPPPHLDEIEHDPWPNPDSNDLVAIRAHVSDETGVASVILKWWVDGTPQADLTMYDDGAHDDYGAGDGWYGVQIGPFPVGTIVEYQVEITDVDSNTILAPQYRMWFESLEPFVKTADILFVPDYGGYDTDWFRSYYEDALGTQGYQYDVWDTGRRGEIDSVTLNQYLNGAVIWAAPDWGFVTSSDYTHNTLQSYLDNGGNLFITGQNIGSYAGWTTFYQDYLHADYVQDNVGLTNLTGVSGDPIGDGLSFSVAGGDGANNQYSPDEIDPVLPAVTILTYSGSVLAQGELRMPKGVDEEREPFTELSPPVPAGLPTQRKALEQTRVSAKAQGVISSGSGAIRVDTGTYKVVYFAFGFEGINAAADRDLVMRRVMAWFEVQPDAGILLEMKNQANEPAVDAWVEAYSDTSSWPDFRGYTDPYGSVWVDVPNGMYTLVVSSGSDNFIIVKGNVSAPSSPTLDTTGTVSVYVEAKKLDGTPLSASIYFNPYLNSLGGVGGTDTDGNLTFNATPMTYNAFAWSWSELYYLSKPDTTISGSTVTFRAAEMDTGQINIDLLDFAEMTFFPFGTYTNWGPVFHVGDGCTVVLSADVYYIYNELMKNNTSTWYYEIDTGDNPYTITAGGFRTIEAGGDFTACMMPDKSFYNAGDDVNINNYFTDAFGNEITWVWEYTSGQSALGELGVGAIRSIRENGARDKGLLKGEVQMSSWPDVCPTIMIKDPNNQTIVDENSCGIWWGYQFALSSSATSGIYSVNLSLDTGPHQGVVEVNGHFTVNCIFGDVNCNCEVKVDDIAEVASRWRTYCHNPDPDNNPATLNYDPLYDIDKDGDIDVVDIMLVVKHWGETCE
jgi:hypothetical protein